MLLRYPVAYTLVEKGVESYLSSFGWFNATSISDCINQVFDREHQVEATTPLRDIKITIPKDTGVVI